MNAQVATNQKIMFCVLKHHVNRLVLQHDFSQSNNVVMLDFPIQLFKLLFNAIHAGAT